MRLIDFEYDGLRLSDLDCLPCSFDGGEDVVSVGNTVSFTTVRPPKSDRHRQVSFQFEEPFQRTISIAKDPCKTDVDAFTEEEIGKVMMWLNRTEFNKFRPFYDDDSFPNVYYNASFNISLIYMGGNVVGFQLELDTDSPYAYSEPVTVNGTNSVTVVNDSDVLYPIPCTVKITAHSSGRLVLNNSLESNSQVEIEKVTAGEIITLNGDSKIITSSINHQKLYNEFNYNFIKLTRTMSDKNNVISSNIDCSIEVTYIPVKKVGLIV